MNSSTLRRATSWSDAACCWQKSLSLYGGVMQITFSAKLKGIFRNFPEAVRSAVWKAVEIYSFLYRFQNWIPPAKQGSFFSIVISSILLIILRSVWVGTESLMAKLTSYRKFHFNEFVANVLPDNIGIGIFDLRGHGGCWRPKIPLGGQKDMKDLI